jgi:hypothetical protein
MARERLTFRQRDVTAAVKATEAAGWVVARVEIERDGRIVVIPTRPTHAETLPVNDWDEVLAGPSEIHP